MSNATIVRRGGLSDIPRTAAILHIIANLDKNISITKSGVTKALIGHERNGTDIADFITAINSWEFGTYTVSNGTDTAEVTIEAAQYYEVELFDGITILSSTLGLKSGYDFTATSGSAAYDSTNKTITLTPNSSQYALATLDPDVDITNYNQLHIVVSGTVASDWKVSIGGLEVWCNANGNDIAIDINISNMSGEKELSIHNYQSSAALVISEIKFLRSTL